MFAQADVYIGDKLIRAGTYPGAPAPMPRGRPPKPDRKIALNIRLSPDVIAAFRAMGPGWQAKIDGALKEWLAGRGKLSG